MLTTICLLHTAKMPEKVLLYVLKLHSKHPPCGNIEALIPYNCSKSTNNNLVCNRSPVLQINGYTWSHPVRQL